MTWLEPTIKTARQQPRGVCHTDHMKKLYVAYLGGAAGEGRFGEDHEVVVVVADGQMGAMSKARTKWKCVG